MAVLALPADGVCAVQRRPDGTSDGLWRLDPGSGASPRQLRPSETGVEWEAAADGAAWAAAGAPAASALWRLDLAGGGVPPWLSRPGASLRVIGLDGDGHPLLQVATAQSSSLWLVTARGSARQVSADVPGGDDTPGYTAAVADRADTWVSDDGGNLFVLPAGGTLQRVPAPRLFRTLLRAAGRCS